MSDHLNSHPPSNGSPKVGDATQASDALRTASQTAQDNDLALLVAQLAESRSGGSDMPPPPPPPQQEEGLLAPAPFSAIAAHQEEAQYAAEALTRRDSSLSHDRMNLDPQLGGGHGADPMGLQLNGNTATKRTASEAFPNTEEIRGSGSNLSASVSASASASGSVSGGDRGGGSAPHSRPVPDFVRLTAAGGYHSRDPTTEADPTLRYWHETPAGWITAAAHPYAAAGLFVEDAWSAQARKAIEAVPNGYMRFFKLIDRKQRLSNPRRANKAADQPAEGDQAAAAVAATAAAAAEAKEVKLEWREIYRCKACGAEQDSPAGHTENVQKHIRLRKCKRLQDPPFRSGLLQDKDSLVQAVLKLPNAEKGNDRTEAAALAQTAATGSSSASVGPGTVDILTISSIRDFLLEIRRPFSFVGSPQFSQFFKEMKVTAVDLGQTPEADLLASLKHADGRLDTLLQTCLDGAKERHDASFASLCVLPIKPPGPTGVARSTRAQVLLWLHHASSINNVGWMSVACATIDLADTDPEKPSADATLYTILQQSLAGLEMRGTNSIPVRISNPALAPVIALGEAPRRPQKFDCVPEPVQTISRAAELLLAHLGLDVASKTMHLTLSTEGSAPGSQSSSGPRSELAHTLNAELCRPRRLRVIAGKSPMPESVRKAMSVIYAASEAVLLVPVEEQTMAGTQPWQVLLDLTRAELGSFTWRDWAAALMAFQDIQQNSEKKPTRLGSIPTMTPAELEEMQTITALLRQMISVTNLLESPGGSLGNELPVIWSTATSFASAAQKHIIIRSALQAAADELRRDALLFAQSKAHLLATVLHPSHRVIRLYKLDATLATRALDLLTAEFVAPKLAPETVEGQPAAGQAIDYGDIFPDLVEQESGSVLYSNFELKAALNRFDAASHNWLAGNGVPFSTSVQAYWGEPGRPEVLVRAANRYLWMPPLTASKLAEEACFEAAQFGTGGGLRDSSGDFAMEEGVLGLVMHRLRRFSRKTMEFPGVQS
ncbi:hypothetical protein A4X09_0g2205 [Tilletia walkeri]|uniref:Uncharacterized protein n=1 Tax=Tilletia walkeri TaxID=117179 RepID=A0A8X7NDP5_9BASI|nr:hypothetical protein A4X09_0g2205 [Tilletia walkeri]